MMIIPAERICCERCTKIDSATVSERCIITVMFRVRVGLDKISSSRFAKSQWCGCEIIQELNKDHVIYCCGVITCLHSVQISSF